VCLGDPIKQCRELGVALGEGIEQGLGALGERLAIDLDHLDARFLRLGQAVIADLLPELALVDGRFVGRLLEPPALLLGERVPQMRAHQHDIRYVRVLVEGVVPGDLKVVRKVERGRIVLRAVNHALLQGAVQFAPRDRRRRAAQRVDKRLGGWALLDPDLQSGEILRTTNRLVYGIEAARAGVVEAQSAQRNRLAGAENLP
jgi:hypothetical protein